MKNQTKHKKLVLKKQSIAQLSEQKMSTIKAGGFHPCWENLWTTYNCDIVWTGGVDRPDPPTANC